MAAGRNVIGILGPAAAVGLGFFVPTVFYGVQPTPDTITQLRTPYLSPPFKFRNNQIDQSQSLNLPMTTQPFGPFDWSKPFFPVIRVDNHQPTNINLLTNPIPLGPYDYSNGPEPVRRFAPDQTYPNIALTQTPVAPPVVTPDYSNGPENVRRFAPDQTYPNIVLIAAYVAGAQATLRDAYLSPPFKFRNNQIDASQPLNLPLQPVVANPFIPVDYNISHDVVSAPPQHPPYNINIFTNPLPFIPVDYNISHDVVSSPPQARPYNINLQTNPIPFGPYDYSEGPTQFRLRVPDQLERNVLIFSEVPFVPVDYNISHDVAVVPPQVIVRNVLIYSEVPVIPFDWSARPGQYPPRAPDQLYPNLALTTVVTVTLPFGPFDWSKPAAIRTLPVIPAPPYNPNLFTNPIPFGPYDYSVGPIQFRLRIPDPIERNPNIFSEVPFIPVDYNIAHSVIRSPPQPQPYNPNLLTNPIPFGPFDYNIAHTVISSPPQALPYNINIFVNPIPFGPFDWTGRPPQMPSRAPDQIARNPNIFSEVPTVPIDWSARPQQFPPRAPDQIYPNITINVTPPPQAPFAQYDWSKPFFPRTLKEQAAQTNINLYQNPIPFGPYDLSYRPSQFPPRAPDQLYYNIVLNVTAAQPPIIPFDWNRPFFPRVLKENAPQTNVNLFTNPIPLGPYDWSARPGQFPPRAPDVFHRNPLIFSEVPLINTDFSKAVRVTAPPLVAAPAYNVALYQPPLIPINLSTSRTLPGLPPQPQPYNIALLTPTGPAPFTPIDWSKPFAVRQAALQAQLNLTITLPPPPPPPIIPFDWNRPYAVRLSPPQPQPNLTLFLPPPVIIGVPGLAFSKDFAIASSRAYEMVLAKARPSDLALWRSQADTVLPAQATAKDIAAFKASANEIGRWPLGLGFRYGPVVPSPVIISLSSSVGYPGEVITVTGTNLHVVTEIIIGGIPATFTIVSDTIILVTVP